MPPELFPSAISTPLPSRCTEWTTPTAPMALSATPRSLRGASMANGSRTIWSPSQPGVRPTPATRSTLVAIHDGESTGPLRIALARIRPHRRLQYADRRADPLHSGSPPFGSLALFRILVAIGSLSRRPLALERLGNRPHRSSFSDRGFISLFGSAASPGGRYNLRRQPPLHRALCDCVSRRSQPRKPMPYRPRKSSHC